MGKKGGSRHLKRLPAPPFWPIHVKEAKWTVKPHPGPHPIGACIPLLIIVRDILGYAKTAREAKIAISEGKVKVDGKVRRDRKFPVGLMDVVEVFGVESPFRVLPVYGKGLTLVEIPKEEAKFKLCRIQDKTTVKGGHIQLNLHDGRNLLIKVKNPRAPEEDVYKTKDTVQLSLPEGELAGHLKFEEGAYALVTAGANVGRHGRIVEIVEGTATRPPMVSLEDSSGRFQTIADYAFVIGREKPVIKVAEPPALIKAKVGVNPS